MAKNTNSKSNAKSDKPAKGGAVANLLGKLGKGKGKAKGKGTPAIDAMLAGDPLPAAVAAVANSNASQDDALAAIAKADAVLPPAPTPAPVVVQPATTTPDAAPQPEAAVQPAPVAPAAPKPPRVPTQGIKIQKDRITRNGITQPSTGTQCRAVWDAMQAILDAGTMPTSKDVRRLAADNAWNLNNTSIEFYRWRKFVAQPVTPAQDAPAAQ